MQEIHITHNPFTVKTEIRVNGHRPAENSPLRAYENQRLQQWVETLFEKLRSDFNGERNFRLSFTGVEADWLDICEAADKIDEKITGMNIELVPPQAFDASGEERLKKVIALAGEAKSFLNLDDGDFKETFAKARDKNFDVFVVATMSSGKSTLINAILGKDLLPAANEATTATIAEIHDVASIPAGKFNAQRFDRDGKELGHAEGVRRETLEEWNKDKQTSLIKLEGKIQGVTEREHVRLVLTDTPGPNSSQNEDHKLRTMASIQDDAKNPLVLYILNGTQLGTDDDKRLLELVSENMEKGGKQAKDRFIFVANKMDDFDPEIEKISGVLERVRKYLESNGIVHPQVYPVTARLAYLLRKEKVALDRADVERLTYTEQGDIHRLKHHFDVDAPETADMDMEQYMPLTSRVKAKLEARNLPPLLRRSGIPALESMIDEYIDKYSFPYRVKHACDALREAIRKGTDKARLESELKTGIDDLKKTEEAIDELEAKRKKGFDVEAYKEKVKREGKTLPRSVAQKLSRRQDEVEPFMRRIDAQLQGQVSKSEAGARLKVAKSDLKFKYKELINEYEKLFKSAQKEIRQDLKQDYQHYIQSLFPESKGLQLPILESIRDNLGDISLDLGVRAQDVKERYRYETEVVEQEGAWGWLKRGVGSIFGTDWGTDEITHKVKTGEYVDLHDRWLEARTNVDAAFVDLRKKAKTEIESGHDKLLKEYLDFMSSSFDREFKKILDGLKEKISSKEKCRAAIEQAQLALQKIADFEKKLDKALSVGSGEIP
ncbi:hypothetical protein AGMMS49960_03030 [Betaproteobacteria bacterium]|nr:hypothetical protein AGMMS49543_01870 [Betaproteobacteria bacterium]GHT98941.1 hypothetical protein AGMMS49960_03030 [Betaproteobacteria bacterium]GHU19621.1 hypothetical protein AGMMS50243_12070 [Betaproteobacteria bacterium]